MHNTITRLTVGLLLAISLLSPIGLLQAGGTSGSIISSSDKTDPNLSSTIPNSTPDFTTETKTSNTGKTLTCVNYTGDPECAGTGNPINVITGNKYQHDIDMPALPGIMGLSLERHYNSLHMGLGQLGYGWRLNYETNLYVISNTIQIVKADGSRVIFNRSILNPNDCACQNPAQGHVMIYPGVKGKEYTWFQLDGTQLHFNHQGKLERISAPTGESTYLTRGLRGELLRVTDPQGRSLIMHYADKKDPGFKGIIAIDTPVGRFEYAHNNDPQSPGVSNLILVRKPTGADHQSLAHQTLEQHYHYGEADYIAKDMAAANTYPAIPHAAHLLTGISHNWQTPDPADNSKTISHNKRYRTWAYDNLGRGILSVHGTPKQLDAQGQRKPNTGINQVSLSYQLQAPKQAAKQTAKQTASQANNKPYPRITRKGEIGTTIITNSLGQQTTYTYRLIAGEYRLHKVIGAGCAECSEANVVYAYDEQARMTHITKIKPTTDGKGNTTLQGIHTTQIEYDSVGRIKRVADIAYINGKAQTPQLKVRYAYPSTPTFPVLKNAINGTQEPHQVTSKPSLIAVPSVIKGKEHQWHITYNDHGQPLKVTETGYAPALPTAQSTTPQLMSRTTDYRYSEINGRSLLSQTDGPLPNGKTNAPQDSDITQYQYNQRGEYLTQVVAPNNIITKLDYDLEGVPTAKADTGGTGRVVVSTLNDGVRQIQTNISYSNNPESLNQATQITRTAWLLDANGQLDTNSSQTLAVLEAVYDVHGKRILHKGSDGEQTMTYNEAGQPVTLTNNQGESLNWAYDAQANPLAQVTADAKGKVIDGRMWLRDEADQLRAVLSPKGVEHMVVNMSAPQKASTQTAGVSQISENNSQSKGIAASALARIKLRDDFGRTVYEQHPEDGAIITTFNPVNDAKLGSGEIQTQTRISLDGLHKQIETLHFTFAGQLLTRERSADGEPPCIDTLEYKGKLLQSLKGCGGEQTFERNAFGQITTQTQTVYPAKQKMAGKTFTQHFSYDNAGKLISRTLPTQQVLNYGYEAKQNSSQTQSIQLQSAWLTRVAKLTSQGFANSIANTLPESWTYTKLISQVQQQPFNATMTALQNVKHGNGITTTWQTSKQSHTNNAVPLMVKVSAALNAQFGIAPQAIQTKPVQPVAQALDAFGRQTQHTPSTGANKGKPLTLQWNVANQLMAVLDANTQKTIARYGYDSTGNRVSKTIYTNDTPPQTTYYAYDNAHKLIAESKGGNDITRQYLYLDHRLHSLLEGNDIYAVSTDWRGLPQSVTDKNKQTVWAREMDAWGNLIHKKILTQPQRIADLNIRLAGQYYDAETGLHYNIHRYFNPQTHQYISPDPLGTPDGNDRYAYLNGNPNAGIDPLGLFKVPTGAFFGFDKYFEDRDVSAPDTGHGDILRVAFAQYNREKGFRFSDEIVRQIIVNNYHSDANGKGCFSGFSVEGGGQCNTLNHFDNPNDGAVYQVKYLGGLSTIGDKYESYTDGENDNWIADSMKQINENREDYNYVDSSDLWISQILNAFGQNSHALADFYAHSNWVDAQDRGGYFEELVSVTRGRNGPNKKYKCGFVPVGLNRTEIWDETSDLDELYSGTIATKEEEGLNTILCTSINPVTNAAGDVECSDDMTTHGYWAKDKASELGGSQQYKAEETKAFSNQGKFFWQVQEYDPKKPPIKIDPVTGNEVLAIYGKDWYGDNGKAQATLVKGDRIYVHQDITNRYQMAYYLAVEATKKEIERLYQATQDVKVGPYSLHEVFKQSETWLKSHDVQYTDLYKKTH